MVVVLVPSRNADLFAAIKRTAECYHGLYTLVVVLDKEEKSKGRAKQPVPDIRQQFLGNLCMKINLQMSHTSVNQRLVQYGPILTPKTMIIGIDVTHPGETAMIGAPSVAAVVGSIDSHFAQWPVSLRANYPSEKEDKQGKKKRQAREEVDELKAMVLERLQAYMEENKGRCPDKLIVYRDGLSESQFDKCRTYEFQQIKAAITTAKQQWGWNEIPILLMCAVKRHHNRLFPDAQGGSNGLLIGDDPNEAHPKSNDNPRPGTLVTQGITYGQGQDYFLISQKAIIGTARPTHYVILQNELAKTTLENIAVMTHNLCYLYGRATRSVSICPAAYYADLAAERARSYVRYFYNPKDRVNFDRSIHERRFQRLLTVNSALQKRMFYI
jgi:hypothetical protein